MKRMLPLPVAMLAISILLILGWAGFELFEPDRHPIEPDPSLSPERERTAVSPAAVAGEIAETERGSESSVVDAEAPRPLFDWRSAPERHAVTGEPDHAPVPRKTAPAVAMVKPGANAEVSGTDRISGSLTRQPPARSGTMPVPSRASTRDAPQTSPTPSDDETRDDPSEDIRPPELEWIRFAPPEVAAGQESMVSASAVDDLAGVREIVGRISSPSGNAHLGFALSFNEPARSWEAMIRIPEKAESGRWQITWLRLTDKANNARDERWGTASPPGSFLIVRSPEGDGDPPVLSSVVLDRTTMGPGEAVEVTVDVRDEQSSVRFVSGTFQSPSGKAWAPFTTTEQGGLWKGPVTVPEDGECGEWTLRRITAIDEANNQATWGSGDERIAGITFYRSFSGSCDSEPPLLTRLELNPKTVANESPSKIQVTAFIDDVGSGVASASGFVMVADQTSVSPQRVHFVLRKSSEAPGAPWVGVIEIPQHSMVGRWEIRALRISDQARNQRTWGPADPAMSDGWFVVE